jgi:hypothetical protein
VEIPLRNIRIRELIPLSFGRDDVEEDGADEGEGGRDVGFIDGEAVADAGAAVVAGEDEVAWGGGGGGGGGDGGAEGFEEGEADGFFGVLGGGGGDAVAGEFGDEEGDAVEEEGDDVAPAVSGGQLWLDGDVRWGESYMKADWG